MISGIFLMIINLLLSFKGKRNALSDPWGGTTLEWTTPSPPPVHNFLKDPKILDYPYDFSKVIEKFSKPFKGE